MSSVSSLGANWCVSIQYTKENLAEFLTELSAKGLHALTRPGHSSELVYVFVNDQTNRVPLIASQLKYVTDVVQVVDFETKSQRENLAKRLVKKPLMVSDADLQELSRVTGSPETALYFAYAKYYTRWLMVLALVGVAFRFFVSNPSGWEFNVSYTIIVMLWATCFVCSWKLKKRAEFSTLVQYSPSLDQLKPVSRSVFIKKLLFIPVALQFAACLIAFQFVCFLLEIFMTQIYQGPLASVLALTPTVLMAAYVPILTMVYDLVLQKLVSWENPADPVQSKLEKKFILTFLTSYMPLFITLFVYLPLGHHVNAQLETIALFCSNYNVPVLKSGFKVNTGRYQAQYFFFMVTGQVIALCVENLVPLAMSKAIPKLKGFDKPNSPVNLAETKMAKEYPEDLSIWKQASGSCLSTWGEFDVNATSNKLIIQFGYVSMFSCIWPLAALCCVVFNLLSLKLEIWRCLNKCVVKCSSNSNVAKISPRSLAPNKSGSIWDNVLNVILWISALVAPALVIMYKSPLNAGTTSALEKRDLWHLESVVKVDWRAVVIGAFVFEHLTFFCYLILGELVGRSDEDRAQRFVSAEKLEEPPHVDLTKVVKETATFMDAPPEGETIAASKAPQKTSDSASQAPIADVATASTSGFSRAKEAASPSQPVKTSTIQATKDVASPASQTSSSSSQVKNHNESSGSLTSPVAGATVPDTIPTSKNYHLRRNHPNSSSSTSQAIQSIDSSGKEKLELTSSNDTSSLKNSVPKVVATSPSDEAITSNQFVPAQLADTSKGHVANIMNGLPKGGHGHTDSPIPNDAVVEKNSDHLSEASSSAPSGNESQTIQTPRKVPEKASSVRTHSSKKKMKGVLSPLGKLKKKFP
ncbi:LADA_0D02278g1_1 [Lachancea dasiensis]|uniref:LADA_0D02278g1_1 n=1 Tax=Lachancea dasiensis TaxID=1072105 RepID=A0A1G4J4E9_9SACH|nr:LADA_0D02278g1_1 [Lachancea dasiensis]